MIKFSNGDKPPQLVEALKVADHMLQGKEIASSKVFSDLDAMFESSDGFNLTGIMGRIADRIVCNTLENWEAVRILEQFRKEYGEAGIKVDEVYKYYPGFKPKPELHVVE